MARSLGDGLQAVHMRLTTFSLVVYFISAQIQAQDGSYIFWDADRKLNWEDFRGEISENEYRAETHWRIYYDFQISIINQKPILSDYHVRTEFSNDKSWVREGGGSDHLLKHEQGHFDLAEVYARIFRSQLDSLTFSSSDYQKEIDSLFHELLASCDEAQNHYDLQTDHGLQPEIQEDWQDFIQQELNVLEDYSYSE